MTGKAGTEIDALGETIAVRDGEASRTGEREREWTSPPLSQDHEAFDTAATHAASASGSATFPGGTDQIDLRPFGPYTQVEMLSEQGSMGVVARGYNEAIGRWELLKFLRADHALDASRMRQFHREGRILARLSHPNVVQVFAIYRMEGQPCLAMEYLQGEPLSAVVASHPEGLPLAQWYEIFLDAARGLAAAHQMGLLHRDLKPDNLFVVKDRKGGRGGLKLIDFGLATAELARRDGEARDSGLIADVSGGTPVYMAPEIWGGQLASARSDVFALGLTFTKAATGRLPFQATTLVEALSVMTSPEPFPDPREARPELPIRLAEVLRRAVDKAPEKRFETADDLVAALVAAGEDTRTRRVPRSGPYRGLRPYGVEERDVFFGRDVEIAEVTERMRSRAGVVLAGPGGSGKTSLVQAGVIPAVLEGGLGGNVTMRLVAVEPHLRPLQRLAAVVADATSTPEAQVLSFLQRTPHRLAEAMREACTSGQGFVVVVDPLESITSREVDPTEAHAFCRALASLVDTVTPQLRLLTVVRADRMDRLFALEPLRPLLTHGFYPVRPLRGDALRRALSQPADAAGYAIEQQADLDALLEEVDSIPAGLPLASFAMSAWWERRDEAQKLLPSSAWAELGGVAGALVGRAETVLAGLDRDHRAAAEALLLRLVGPDGSKLQRRRDELLDPGVATSESERALDSLLEEHIVQDTFGQVELVHEALITRWPRLQTMLDASGDDRVFRERVAGAANIWESQGRPDGALWTAQQATDLERWFKTSKVTLSQVELAFCETVRRRVARKRLVTRSVVAAAVLIAGGFLVTAKTNERSLAKRLDVAVGERDKARDAFRKTEARRLRLVAETQIAKDPRAALATAAASFELESDEALDALAWHAHALGIPHPVPRPSKRLSTVRFSPNGKRFAIGAHDGKLLVFDSVGSEHAAVAIPDDDVTAIAFSPDGKRMLVGTASGAIGTGVEPRFALQSAKACDTRISEVAMRDDGTALAVCASGSETRVVRIALPSLATSGVARGTLVGPLHGELLPVGSADGTIAWGDDAKRTKRIAVTKGDFLTAVDLTSHVALGVVGTRSGEVRVLSFDAPKDKAGKVVHRCAAPVARVQMDPEGRMVVAFSRDGIAHATLLSSGKTRSFPVAAQTVEWVPARDAVALVDAQETVTFVSTRTGEAMGSLRGATAEVVAMDSDPTGRWLVSVSRDGGARAYALEEALSRVRRGPLDPPPSLCAMSPDGVWVACTGTEGVRLEPVEPDAGAGPKGSKKLVAKVVSVPDGTKISAMAVARRSGDLYWVAGGALFRNGERIATKASPSMVIAASSSEVVVTLGSSGSRVEVEVIGSGDKKSVTGALPASVALSPDGTKLALATAPGVSEVEVATGIATAHDFPEGSRGEAITALAWSDDGDSIVAGTRSGRFLTARSGDEALRSIGQTRAPITCISLARSGRAVVATSQDGVISVLDAHSGEVMGSRELPSAAVHCARSPVEDRFVFVSQDGSLRLRWFDLAPLATSRVPEDARKVTDDAAGAWQGLPTERSW